MAKKFFKTVFTIEVLSEDRPISEEISLTDLEYAITDGDCSGSVQVTECKEITPKEAAHGLMEQGSDPGFFGLDENGNFSDRDDDPDNLYDENESEPEQE